MTQIADLSVLVRAEISNFTSGMNSVQTQVTGLSGSLRNIGSSMTQFGANTAALTLPIAAGLGLAVNAALDFDAAMTNVNSILQLGAEDAAALNQEILDIGGSAVAGPQAVAEAYYDIVGAVSDADSRLPILNASIAASEAGAASLSSTVSALTGAMNAYGASADEAGYYSDIMTQTVAMGVGTMDEFAAAMPTATGTAAALGISFEDLNAQAAFITTRGVSASQAYTQLGSAMSALMSPSTAMEDALYGIGFESGQAAVESLGLAGTFQALIAAGYEVGDLGLSIEGVRAAIALTDAGANTFFGNFSAGVEGATARAREIQLGGASTQFALLKSSVDELGITLGGNVLVALEGIATNLTPIVQSITDWATANPELSGTIVALVGGAAALGIGAMILGPIISGLGTVFGGLGTALSIVTSPLGLIVGAIVGLVAISGDLPALGAGLGEVVSAAQRIGSGDSTAWDDLAASVVVLAGLSLVSLADGFINLIDSITPGELPSVAEGFAALGQGLNDAWLALQIVGVMIHTELSKFGLGVQLRVQQFIADLRQTILDMSAGTIDIAPNIQMDIATTQAQIQANIDAGAAAITALTNPVEVTGAVNLALPAEQVTVDATGVEWSAINTIAELSPASEMSTSVTLSGSAYETTAVRDGAVAAVVGTPVDASMNASVTLTATVDASSAQATISASIDSLGITSSGGFGGAGITTAPVPVATTNPTQPVVTVTSGATGVDVYGEGLMYVHAGERLLNAADTERYRAGENGGGAQQNFYINSYGNSPYELYTMNRRALRNAAPE